MKEQEVFNFDVRTMSLTGLMTAVICVMGPFSVPVGPVPITLANFAIYLAAALLGWQYGTVSCFLYLLIGLAGVPVLSGFSGGPGKLLGPTGGYMIGYLFMALLTGYFTGRFPGRKFMSGLGMALGTLICYIIGTGWLAVQAGMDFAAALGAGVLPFIPGDALKIVLAVILGGEIKKRLLKTGYL